MEKVKTWFFLIKENGKNEIVAYGDSTEYTQEQATKGIKAVCNARKNFEFIRTATIEEACK